MPPEIIAGRYRVEREVGRGGMGSVWLCRDERLGRAVAAKQVGHLPGESTPDLARALREARSSAPLNHRNVVSIYDAIEEGDHIWLVMEYVPGRTLSQIMAEDGPVLPERAAWIGAQVADGLAAAHARGTVHRDVKPGNILVTDEDQAKIADFGISRTTGDPTLTQTGMVTGTPAYFSPQLARGGDSTPADDVWALGATLYAAVEGRPPFPEQRNAIAMLSTIASGRPSRPQRGGFLNDPIGRMLDPDPASRWSMADVAHTLHRLHEEHDSAGTREETPLVVPAAPAADTAATPVAPAPVAPAPVAPAPVTPAPVTAAPVAAGPSRQRRRRTGVLVLAALVVAGLLGGAWLLIGPGADQSGREPSAGGVPSHGRSGSGKPSATASDTPSSPDPSGTPAPSGSPSQFAERYYGVLPDGTEAGWSMLTPGFQRQIGSYGDYRGFWSTIDSVTVDKTAPAGPDAVDVSLTYTSGGGTQREVRRLYLERGGDGYLIADDAVVG